jgi:hypothetical protein
MKPGDGVFAGAAVALAFAFVACGGGSEVDTSNVDVEQLLTDAADRMDQVQSFSFDLEHENGTATIVRGLGMTHAKGNVGGADRMHLKVRVRAGPLNAEIEVIVLPDEGWITNPFTGRWEREQIDVASFFDPSDGVIGLMRSIEGGEVTGTETIDGVETYRVEADVPSEQLTLFGNPREDETIRVTAWIGIDDPLVHRVEAVGGIVPGEPDDLLRRLTFRDFDQTFDIQAPR